LALVACSGAAAPGKRKNAHRSEAAAAALQARPKAVAKARSKARGVKRKAEATANERIATTRTQKIVRDIARLQESTHLLIPKSSFTRTVKECLDNVIAERPKEARPDCPSKMTREAISMLQECAEAMLTDMFPFTSPFLFNQFHPYELPFLTP